MNMFNEFDASTTYGKVHVYSKGSGAKVVLLLHGAGDNFYDIHIDSIKQLILTFV